MPSKRMKRLRTAVVLLLFGVLYSSLTLAGEGLSALAGHAVAPSGQTEVSMGTGWPIGDGYVVTNFHVVANHTKFALVRTDHTVLKAQLLYADRYNDIALLHVADPRKLPRPLPLAADPQAVGESVFTIGYPQPKVMGASPKLATGIINSLTGIQDDPRMFQMSVNLHEGNSGGPLINMYGQVVGIVTAKLNAAYMYKHTGELTENVNYALKIAYVRPILKLIQGFKGASERRPRHPATLEQLSARYMNSMLIVVAGYSPNQASPSNTANGGHHAPRERLVVATYSEPANYDANNYPKADTVETMSKATNQLAVAYVRQHDSDAFQIVNAVWGNMAKDLMEDSDNNQARRQTCRQSNAQALLIVDDPLGFDHFNRIGRIVFYDCAKNTKIGHSYTLFRRGEDKDFGYQTDIRRKLAEFMQGLPVQ